jgi:hypothetical protein
MRTSFPEYVIAIVTIVGSILFAVCASSLYIASQEALNTWAGMENFISELFELLFSFGFLGHVLDVNIFLWLSIMDADRVHTVCRSLGVWV